MGLQFVRCNRAGPGSLDVAFVVFHAEDVEWAIQENLCADCWLANNGGNGSARSFRCEQHPADGCQPCGVCWVETVMRRKYMKITKNKRKLKKRKEALVLSGSELGHTSSVRRREGRFFATNYDGTVQVHNRIRDVQWSYFHALTKLWKGQ